MSVRIAEVQAESAARPRDAAFNRYAGGVKAASPFRFIFSRDSESQMRLTIAIVRRKNAPGKYHRLQRRAFLEQQKHLLTETLSAQKRSSETIFGKPKSRS